MSQAWQYIWYIFSKFINFIFNETVFTSDGATIGWVAVVVFIFGMLIKSLLNLPRHAPRYTGRYETISTGQIWSDHKGTIHSERHTSRIRVK